LIKAKIKWKTTWANLTLSRQAILPCKGMAMEINMVDPLIVSNIWELLMVQWEFCLEKWLCKVIRKEMQPLLLIW